MRPLTGKWFIGIKPEEKVEVEQLIRNSTTVLDQLTKVIEAELHELEALKVTDYTNPNWAYQQADKNGAIRVLKNLLLLTRLDRDNKQGRPS